MENKELNYIDVVVKSHIATSYLYNCDFMTDAEKERIRSRIKSYQDKYKIDNNLIINELKQLQ